MVKTFAGEVSIQNLLLGWAKFELDNNNNIVPKFDKDIKVVFEDLLNSYQPSLSLNGVLAGGDKKFNGKKHNYDFLLTALDSYQNLENHFHYIKDIDKKALIILEDIYIKKTCTCICKHNLLTYSDFNFINYHNNGSIEQDERFFERFINLLICRRVVLGIYKLSEKGYFNIKKNRIVFNIFEILTNKKSRGAESTIKHWLTLILGLSVSLGNESSINISFQDILKEESEWLNIIESEMSNKRTEFENNEFAEKVRRSQEFQDIAKKIS